MWRAVRRRAYIYMQSRALTGTPSEAENTMERALLSAYRLDEFFFCRELRTRLGLVVIVRPRRACKPSISA